jgi:hypothetical protein
MKRLLASAHSPAMTDLMRNQQESAGWASGQAADASPARECWGEEVWVYWLGIVYLSPDLTAPSVGRAAIELRVH